MNYEQANGCLPNISLEFLFTFRKDYKRKEVPLSMNEPTYLHREGEVDYIWIVAKKHGLNSKAMEDISNHVVRPLCHPPDWVLTHLGQLQLLRCFRQPHDHQRALDASWPSGQSGRQEAQHEKDVRFHRVWDAIGPIRHSHPHPGVRDGQSSQDLGLWQRVPSLLALCHLHGLTLCRHWRLLHSNTLQINGQRKAQKTHFPWPFFSLSNHLHILFQFKSWRVTIRNS